MARDVVKHTKVMEVMQVPHMVHQTKHMAMPMAPDMAGPGMVVDKVVRVVVATATARRDTGKAPLHAVTFTLLRLENLMQTQVPNLQAQVMATMLVATTEPRRHHEASEHAQAAMLKVRSGLQDAAATQQLSAQQVYNKDVQLLAVGPTADTVMHEVESTCLMPKVR